MNNWYIDRSNNFIEKGMKETLKVVLSSKKDLSTQNLTNKVISLGIKGNSLDSPAAFTQYRDHGLIRIGNSIGDSAKLYAEDKFTFGELVIDLFIKRFTRKKEYTPTRPFIIIVKLFNQMFEMGLNQEDLFLTVHECHKYLLEINDYDDIQPSLVEKIISERKYEYSKDGRAIKPCVEIGYNESSCYRIYFNALKESPLFSFDTSGNCVLKPNEKQKEFFKFVSTNAEKFKKISIKDNNQLYDYYCNRKYGFSEIILSVITKGVNLEAEEVSILFDYLFGYNKEANFDYSKYVKEECFGVYFPFISIPGIAIAKVMDENAQVAEELLNYARKNQKLYDEKIENGEFLFLELNFSLENNDTKTVNEAKFESWMRSQTKSTGGSYFSENTVKHYISALKAASKKFATTSVFEIDSVEEFDEIEKNMRNHPDFEKFNKNRGNGALSAGLVAYRNFLLSPKQVDFVQCVIDAELKNLDEENKMEEKIEKCDSYDKSSFLEDVFMTSGEYDTLKELIDYKQNIILQGSPGVGKTYLAKRLAYSIMGEKDNSRVKMVQFHQNYSYEDFIMGYKPVGSGFELQTGVFYDFCKKAEKDDRPHYFIIDEINRGNVSKIFGELLMLIECDKRGEETVKLAYREELFTVPKNVYIIGMMNTADRSLAIMDYALRRRFSFYEIDPAFDKEKFKKHLSKNGVSDKIVSKIVSNFTALNAYINDEKTSGLGSGFRIGHSYFCSKPNCDEEKWYENIIKYEIAPMLMEYWFDEKDKADEWIGKIK